VVLPSCKEQIQIAAIVDEKFTAIEKLDTELERQLLKAERNKQSILASAFSGQLASEIISSDSAASVAHG